MLSHSSITSIAFFYFWGPHLNNHFHLPLHNHKSLARRVPTYFSTDYT